MPRCLPCLLLLIAPAFTHADDTMAKRNMLVQAVNLLNPKESKEALEDVTFIDVRSRDAYDQGHLPGARHVDAAEWKAAFGDGTDTLEWSQRISSVLPNEHGTVVVYDEATTPTAARIWWILKYWGADDVRLLDGGYRAWQAAGGTPSTTTPKSGEPIDFTAQPQPERLATYQQVLDVANSGAGRACLVDARTAQENTAGKIPTANHLNWEALVDAETGTLRPPAELEQLLEPTGFDASEPSPAITYCQSGGRASLMAFAMELVSGEPVANYYGSWGEWSKKEGAKIEEREASK
jgi:thiosulfate/3-mercaptopyruvate sulfurtransferase